MNGIYIYEQTIVQFFVIPSQNCVLNAGKPSRNIFNCNIFVSLLIFRPFSMVEMGKYLVNILLSFVIKTTSYSTTDYALSRFLVADTQLYKRLCPSLGRPVGRLVGPSHSSWKVGKGAFRPLPTRPQLMAVYPAYPFIFAGDRWHRCRQGSIGHYSHRRQFLVNCQGTRFCHS